MNSGILQCSCALNDRMRFVPVVVAWLSVKDPWFYVTYIGRYILKISAKTKTLSSKQRC